MSIRPIEQDDYASPSDFYENSGDFADYIGDEVEGEERKEDIRHLAEALGDLFTLDEDGETLTYQGDYEMQVFMNEWANAIVRAASAVKGENVLDWQPRYDVRATCKDTHLRTSYRFKIEDWNGDYADEPAELTSYIADKMKQGDKLYIGAIIDYHY